MADKTHEFDAEIFSTGTYHGDKFTLEHLKDMVKNFASLSDLIKPPLKLGHNEAGINDGQPAFGWVKALRLSGEKLIATLSGVPEILYKAIKAGRYKRVSSEIYFKYAHKGNTFNKVLSAVALLGADIPEVKDLADLTTYLAQAPNGGSFDKLVMLSNEVDANGTITPQKEDAMSKELEDKVLKLTEQMATMTADIATAKDEANKYKGEAEKATKKLGDVSAANLEAKKKTDGENLKAFCEAQVKEGKMLPAGRDVIVKGLDEGKHVYNDSGYAIPFDAFKKYQELCGKVLPVKEKARHKEGNETTYDTVQDELHAKAVEYAAEKKVEYADAVIHVLDADIELAERYAEDTPKID